MNWQKEKDVEPYKHAIEECIEKGILADYLKRKGSEAVSYTHLDVYKRQV